MIKWLKKIILINRCYICKKKSDKLWDVNITTHTVFVPERIIEKIKVCEKCVINLD